jgi:hypothetical protein
MTDEQHKFPDPREQDPDAVVTPIDPIRIVQITNPLLVKDIDESCDDETSEGLHEALRRNVFQV